MVEQINNDNNYIWEKEGKRGQFLKLFYRQVVVYRKTCIQSLKEIMEIAIWFDRFLYKKIRAERDPFKYF